MKTRLYRYVLESSVNNKYLVYFDDNIEKLCASGTLKIESQSAVIPPNEVPTTPAPQDSIIEAFDMACNPPDDASLSEEEYPMMDLVNDPAVLNIGAINESVYPPLEKYINNDLQDTDPETNKD